MKTYLRILAYGKEYKTQMGLAILFLLLYNIFSALSLSLLIPFLDIIFSDIAPQRPTQAFIWYDVSALKEYGFYHLHRLMSEEGKMQALVYLCITIGIAILLKSVFRYLSSYNLAPLEQGIVQNLRNKIFEHMSRLSLNYYTRNRRGQLYTLVVSDVDIVSQAIVGTLLPLISDPITMLVFLGMMLLISWKLTLFTLIVLPITGFAISKIAKSLKRRAVQSQSQMDGLMNVVEEFLSGIRVVKSFGAEQFEYERYKDKNNQYTQTMIGFRRRSELASPVTEVLSVGVILIIILYGGMMILGGKGELKPSEFIGFIGLFSQFIAPIKTFTSAISRTQKALASFTRIEALLNEPILNTEQDTEKKYIHDFQHAIELKDVSFSYGDRNVLQNINLTINKGETVALVGPSGSGKTTLVDLICRFYDPSKGAIYLDGIALTDVNATSLRALMGIVNQDGMLFNDTIMRNIAYANTQPIEPEVKKAAIAANADGFINQIPEQYEAKIGERGGALSGGQRQRIAIARAIYRNPPILVLDEATSALDSEAEKAVQDAIEKLVEGRTCIVIAHRLSTVVRAHKIIVLENGQIIETGTHNELLERKGLYYRLYQMQHGG